MKVQKKNFFFFFLGGGGGGGGGDREVTEVGLGGCQDGCEQRINFFLKI